ncbi:MAG TPA: DUF4404 family protein [Steroidobacteraceae bacterium]|nr:DUF4404 family protein [Steroidobacteraceae bacterium]
MNRPDEETLRELLGRVHERLSRADKVDGESRRLLAALTQDVERALGHAKATGLTGESLERLEGLAVRFQIDHPAIAEVVRELLIALRNAGI